MDEARAQNYELALSDYQAGMKYKDIAEKYGVTINTVKSWKTRYRWSKDKKKYRSCCGRRQAGDGQPRPDGQAATFLFALCPVFQRNEGVSESI